MNILRRIISAGATLALLSASAAAQTIGIGPHSVGGIPPAASISVGCVAGTSANNCLQLDGSGKIPAVDGSQVTGIVAPLSGITGLGTGVATALAVNVGSAGALVTFNGAGGTPSSLALTNATGLPLAGLATQAANTLVGNATAGSAAPTALAIGSCATSGSALNWTSNTGFSCNTSISANTAATANVATILQTARAINGVNFDGSAPITVAAAAGTLTGGTLAAGVTASSLISVGTLTGGTWNAGIIGSTFGGSGINNAGTLTWGAGGTLGTNAYTSTAYLPLTAGAGSPLSGTLYGGSAVGSALNLTSTSNGSPSGDSINLTASKFVAASLNGLSTSIFFGTANQSGATITVAGSGGGAQVWQTAASASGTITFPAGTHTLAPTDTPTFSGTRVTFGTLARLNGYTVAGLPGSPLIGDQAYVTDAVACTFLATVTGGGAAFCPVVYNGSAWQGG